MPKSKEVEVVLTNRDREDASDAGAITQALSQIEARASQLLEEYAFHEDVRLRFTLTLEKPFKPQPHKNREWSEVETERQ